jgi:uncharacterized membrane protein
MEVARSIAIARPIDEVFAFVADARNHPKWRPKVLSAVQLQGDGPGPGARYELATRPLPGRPPSSGTAVCVGWEPPQSIEWHENDGVDDVRMRCLFSDLGGATTQVTQQTLLTPATPQRLRPIVLRPVMRHGVGRDIELQMLALKTVLEEQAG